MQKLVDRLEYLAERFHLQAPWFVLSLGLGMKSSPALALAMGGLLVLLATNLAYWKLGREAQSGSTSTIDA